MRTQTSCLLSFSFFVEDYRAVHPTQLLEVSRTVKFEALCTLRHWLQLKEVTSTLSYLRALRNG